MQFVAITQATCSWLLAYPQLIAALRQSLIEEDLSSLTKSEFSSGPIRMAGSDDGRVLAIWNREYLTGTGTETWGLFKLRGPHSLTEMSNISQQVFERFLYVVSQRLQGFVLDTELIHRTWPNGSHTCLAGHGSE